MADNQGKRQRGIEALLAERKKFETWLAQLEERRASSAEHVFLRVHADYTERLDEVRERLRAEADGIRALVSDLEGRLVSEQEAVTEKSDERAELELRASVGEFSEKEWNAIRSRLDGTIGEIRARFDATERELVELKQTLASVSAAPRAPTPAHPSAAIDRDESPAEPGPSGNAGAGRASRAAATSDDAGADEPGARADSPPHHKPTPFDELAFLKSVAGTPTANPVPPRDTPAAQARVAAPSGRAEGAAIPLLDHPKADAPLDAGELTQESAGGPVGGTVGGTVGEPVGGTVGGTVGGPVGPPLGEPVAEPVGALMDERPGALAGEPAGEAGRGARGEGGADAPSRSRRTSGTMTAPPAPLGAPTPRTSQAVRTLKCQECDTLNFPTEWYCERCGGELAAF